MTPQQIKDLLINDTGEFAQKLFDYLSSIRVGEFLTGSMDFVEMEQERAKEDSDYQDPCQTLPVPPPVRCESKCPSDCSSCSDREKWWTNYEKVVDDLMLRVNVHNQCNTNLKKDGTQDKNKAYISCLNNKWGQCKARFPREIIPEYKIGSVAGTIDLKKKEAWINDVSPPSVYALRCNTDFTSLFSGTAMKAAILYSTNYVAKITLKTHTVMSVIRECINKNSEIIAADRSNPEVARKVLTQIVNQLSAKMEIGAPFAALYSIGCPDHYTSHKGMFAGFFWQNYVKEVKSVWLSEDKRSEDKDQKLIIIKKKGRVVSLSPVSDYVYRNEGIEHMSLYDWIRLCHREKIPKHKKNVKQFDSSDIPKSKAIPGENLTTSILHFLPGHPLHDSHGTKVRPTNTDFIPKFLGPDLPRRDGVDREDYACTMLTLFKPWRTGRDLKEEKQTWNEAFLHHRFSSRQDQLMGFFHLRYECLDAKDDFHAQMRKGANPGWLPFADQNAQEDDGYAGYDTSIGPYDYVLQKTTRAEERRLTEGKKVQELLDGLDWTELRPDLVPSEFSSVPLYVQTNRLPTEWQNLIALKKEEVMEGLAEELKGSSEQPRTSTSERPAVSKAEPVVQVNNKHNLESGEITKADLELIASIIEEECLNEEQARFFRIVAEHSCNPNKEPLQIYLGGMGGTGKSKVLNCLREFFKTKGQSHRLLVVAYTGQAAANVGGSTYHSAFFINERDGFLQEELSETKLSELKEKLKGVDYIFIDEISMVPCEHLYLISLRLCRVRNMIHIPFGGASIIKAGDFAQLPPVARSPLYSRHAGKYSQRRSDQIAAIGKAIWHQTTKVVLLRKIMRQRSQSDEDKKFRAALTNMRYRACTLEDLAFLNSRVASPHDPSRDITSPFFRNVSIITAQHVVKEKIDQQGSLRFAGETKQALIHFHSVDTKAVRDPTPMTGKRRRRKLNINLADEIQDILWDLPPKKTGDMPGKLPLCVGMPVMIRYNIATELGITRGRQAFVRGWHDHIGRKGNPVLDVLFVELHETPQMIQLDGLPPNIIPLTPQKEYVVCDLPDGSKFAIDRTQIPVCLNWAMTDYAAQGIGREANPVDLSKSNSHQNYYTALSRGTTAKGTLILQGFDERKIVGTLSGDLRQEYRTLEILDHITKLEYEGKLPAGVYGDRRNTLIQSFRDAVGHDFMPPGLHSALTWSQKVPFVIDDDENHEKGWRVMEQEVKTARKKNDQEPKSTAKVKALVNSEKEVKTETLHCNAVLSKRSSQAAGLSSKDSSARKKQKGGQILCSEESRYFRPTGPSWNRNSCAYDTTVMILYTLWLHDSTLWSERWIQDGNPYLNLLVGAFCDGDIQNAREFIRSKLIEKEPTEFVMNRYTSPGRIINHLLNSEDVLYTTKWLCRSGHSVGASRFKHPNVEVSLANYNGDLQSWVTGNDSQTHGRICHAACPEIAYIGYIFTKLPTILVFSLNQSKAGIPNSITLSAHESNETATYRMCRVIYYGEGHFTSRVVLHKKFLWYYDSIGGGDATYECQYPWAVDLQYCQGRTAQFVFYTL